jgi:hypothetical protein
MQSFAIVQQNDQVRNLMRKFEDETRTKFGARVLTTNEKHERLVRI